MPVGPRGLKVIRPGEGVSQSITRNPSPACAAVSPTRLLAILHDGTYACPITSRQTPISSAMQGSIGEHPPASETMMAATSLSRSVTPRTIRHA